jgi:hypothetical protein
METEGQSPGSPAETERQPAALERFVERDLLAFWKSRPPWLGAFTPVTLLVAAILIFGVYLRTREYLPNRSIWSDEARLSLNIMSRDFRGLLQPLDMDQAAPYGFLYALKLSTMAVSEPVRALRLIPFLASLIALPLFYAAVKLILGRRGAIFALFLLTISPLLLRHAVEVKQYGVEMLATIAVLHASAYYVHGARRRAGVIWLAAAGCVTLLFSHTIMMITASAGLMLLARELYRKRTLTPGLAFAGGVVFAAALLNYLFHIKPVFEHKGDHPYWERFYLPFPPENSEEMAVLLAAPLDLFDGALGLKSPELGAAMLVIGLIAFVVRRQAVWLVLLFVAGMFDIYPYLHERFLVFAVPLVALGVIGGIEGIIGIRRWKLHWAGWVLALLVVGGTARDTMKDRRFWRPFQFQELRPLLVYVQARVQPDDLIYLDHAAQDTYQFYMEWDRDFAALRSHPRVTTRDRGFEFSQLDDEHRVWVIYTHVPSRLVQAKMEFLDEFDRRGRRINQMAEESAWICLYDLSG